jgi:hypothetical protein
MSPSVYLFICLSVYLFVCLPFYLSIYRHMIFICVYIYKIDRYPVLWKPMRHFVGLEGVRHLPVPLGRWSLEVLPLAATCDWGLNQWMTIHQLWPFGYHPGTRLPGFWPKSHQVLTHRPPVAKRVHLKTWELDLGRWKQKRKSKVFSHFRSTSQPKQILGRKTWESWETRRDVAVGGKPTCFAL